MHEDVLLRLGPKRAPTWLQASKAHSECQIVALGGFVVAPHFRMEQTPERYHPPSG